MNRPAMGRDPAVLQAALARSRFRQRFVLGAHERRQLARHGLAGMKAHAERFIAERLALFDARRDGRQTPMRNHPVFVAQHATATCCRACLARWHHIRPGHRLTADEQAYIRDVILDWLARQEAVEPNETMPSPQGQNGPQRSLF